jgi:quercetin dioxygenase-like cupin family protein
MHSVPSITGDPMHEVIVLSSTDLDAIDWTPLHGDERIDNKILWGSPTGDMIVGLMRLQPGAEDAGHVHPAATQHAWILAGRARIAGAEVGPGSFVFVPPGVQHHTAAVGTEPCTMFYVYQPHDLTHGEHQDDDSGH